MIVKLLDDASNDVSTSAVKSLSVLCKILPPADVQVSQFFASGEKRLPQLISVFNLPCPRVRRRSARL